MILLVSHSEEAGASLRDTFLRDLADQIVVWVPGDDVPGDDAFCCAGASGRAPIDDASVPRADDLRRRLGCEFRQVLTINEKFVLLCGFLRSQWNIGGLGLPESIIFRDKLRQKQRLFSAGVRTPMFADPHDARQFGTDGGSSLPILVKPRLGWGSEGITRSTVDAAMTARWAGACMWEEFVDGAQYHCDAMVTGDGRLHYLVCSEYIFPSLDYERSDAGSAVLTDPECAAEIGAFAMEIIQALPIKGGMALHLDIYRRSTGELVAGEVACRPAGYRIRGMIASAIGVDTIGSALRVQVGLPLRRSARFAPIPSGWGGVRAANFALVGNPDLASPPPGIFGVRLHMRPGASRGQLRCAADHVVTFLVRGATRESVITAHSEALSWARSKLQAVSVPLEPDEPQRQLAPKHVRAAEGAKQS